MPSPVRHEEIQSPELSAGTEGLFFNATIGKGGIEGYAVSLGIADDADCRHAFGQTYILQYGTIGESVIAYCCYRFGNFYVGNCFISLYLDAKNCNTLP